MADKVTTCILISAGAEWRSLIPHFPQSTPERTPYGDYFQTTIAAQDVIFLHGGWGKVAAAGSTQYAINRWSPSRIVNLGTCGGFSGQVKRGSILLAKKTIIYDIIEQMTNFDAAIEHYSVDIDLSWLPDPTPQAVTVSTLVSADRDILPADIPMLIKKYAAAVADWESGAISWVSKKNNLPCLILRGVSDLVNAQTGEAYGDYAFFEKQCQSIIANFVHHLPDWLTAFTEAK